MSAATRSPGNHKSRIAPLAASLLVVLLLVGVALAVRDTGRSDSGSGPGGTPPLLHLSTPSGAVALDAVSAGRSRYVPAGPLPAGRPQPDAVYRFGADRAPAGLVRRLASALSVPGTPARTPTGWQLGIDHRILTVRDGGGWAWTLGPSEVVADSPVQCVRAPCPFETPNSDSKDRGQPAPSPAIAERIATAALTALGLPAEDLTTAGTGPLRQVRAPRPVGGLDTDGFSTTLSIGADRRIYAGTGWLGQAARKGPSYPLVSAAEAYKRLQDPPYPEILLCRPQKGGGCAPTPQVRVTGAKLGLMMASDSARPLLVPAWLFRIEGQVDPVAVVAIESRYLSTPATPKPPNSTGQDPGTGGGSLPQSVAPAAPSGGPHPASPKPR